MVQFDILHSIDLNMCRGGETVDALRSGRSALYGRVSSNLTLGTSYFCREWIRIFQALVAQMDRAQPCEG